MPQTILQAINAFSQRQGLGTVTTIENTQDDGILQILALCNEGLDDLTSRASWQGVQYESTFTSTSAEDQGSIDTLAPYGFQMVINGTMWDRTRRLPVYGPQNPQQWQQLKGLPFTGPFYRYRIRQNKLLFIPALPAGNTIAFEYRSNWIVQDNTNPASPTYKQYFTEDADTCRIDMMIITAYLRWAWKAAKGLPYAEEQRSYEAKVADFLGNDGSKPELCMDSSDRGIQPGIFVPAGNWPISN